MRSSWLFVVAGLVGCGTQSGSEHTAHDVDDPCMSRDTMYALDEATPAGFSGQDLLDAIPAETSATLTWSDDGTTTVTFTIAPVGDEAGYTDFSHNPAVAAACENEDGVGMRVAYTIVTADGRIDQSGEAGLWSTDGAEGRMSTNTDGHGGPLDDCVNGEGWEQTLFAWFSADGVTGNLDCEGEGTWEIASW